MFYRLTFAGIVAALLASLAFGEPSDLSPSRSAVDSRATGVTTLSIHWESLPLRDAVARLQETGKVDVFVDRRVDPTQLVDLSEDDATAEDILKRLATAKSLGVGRLESLLYLGPTREADQLSALAARRRADVSHLSGQGQQSWSTRNAINWPRLTEPRDLITRLAQEHRLQIIGAERIPQDLWPAGQLPKLLLSDELTVLLVGFDLTFRPVAGKAAIEIVPITESLPAAPQAAAPLKPKHQSPGAKQNTKQLYTLRVQQQPVGKVLYQLEQQLHLDLKVDEAAIQAAGHSMDERVSFEVKDADLDGLLKAVMQPAGLTYKRDGERITIGPQ